MQISEHSPSIGPVQMLITSPDSRDSLTVERDDRRWQDGQLHIRITKLTQEFVSLENYASLLSARLSEISSDLASERATRLLRESEIREVFQAEQQALANQLEAACQRISIAAGRIGELEDQIVILGERTWWSMLKESLRHLFRVR